MNSQQVVSPEAPLHAPVFLEHRIPRDGHTLYAREHKGLGPTFVLLHGFPDNHHIYDALSQRLAGARRHVVSFDFLGFGLSDKPEGYTYNFAQQLADLETLVDHLKLTSIVPVAHDAGGFTAINFIISKPELVEHLCLLNTFYTNTATLRPPELIQFFATPGLGSLAGQMATDPKLMNFLLTFQQTQFKIGASDIQKTVIDEIVRPIITENFAQTPSAAPAFTKVVADLFPQIAKNTAFIPRLKEAKIPCTIVWGKGDDYVNVGVAQDFASTFKGASLHVLDAGHWPQLDLPDEVAGVLLAEIAISTDAT